ncbi:MAG: bifunctional (p)ppGpp synthetase/guanosine-3',5'-bis(diphosphate) 3'-pyrophosphohydrolase, partial [Leptospiraceae bacterium]|nr:bifunctional (p)ppGpp synthetase/guanosine-3',5'-bis(diphosphate) 3'-pyrophosphohydrolase [Leptospiraceae bacterium]
LIRKAFVFAHRAHRDQKRLSGEPYIVHPLSVARILADYCLDSATIAAGLLHDVVEDTVFGTEVIEKQFGNEINSLVKAVTKISLVKSKSSRMNHEQYSRLKAREAAENIRLMLLATARDVRVILIKLADKLHNMRTLDFQKPEKVKRIAGEVLDIYAPIAGRLGMFRVKSELEDLAFAHLEPPVYGEIDRGLVQSRTEREEYVQKLKKILSQRLAEINIQARIEGRAKHLYSIYQKMRKQDKQLQQIFDLRGVRIIVNEIRDCYGVLGIVHTLWPPIQGRFKDYIAMPKSNGYQSLHTSVVGPDGRPLEIQIRTHAMDEVAEYGVAAHWIYKSEHGGKGINTQTVSWLKRLSNLTDANQDTNEFIEDLRQELDPDEVYVFTPRGDVFDLPVGSTVLDLAFRIHTEIGLCCRGARVNDRIVPLRYELKSGDRVEILTDRQPHPSPNWLRHLKSSRARQKLRSYFRKQDEDIDSLAEEPKPAAPDKNRTKKKKNAPDGQKPQPEQFQSLDELHELRIRRRKTRDPKRVPIEVAGARNIPIRYAGCCSPVPGDRIVGYVTRGRGVTVHRVDCPQLPTNGSERDRIISVKWEGLTEKYPVPIMIHAEDRQGLYLDLVGGITRTYTNILKAEADIPRNGEKTMRARFLLEVEHRDHLNEIFESLQSVPGVFKVERIDRMERSEKHEGRSGGAEHGETGHRNENRQRKHHRHPQNHSSSSPAASNSRSHGSHNFHGRAPRHHHRSGAPKDKPHNSEHK